ncbi:hypothetical protein CQA01_00450 [Cyclobacterium qasimii]|uniref:Uncharacterized protein n=2 Tax=Cyclobacterium qasimii TaxID=1350429 RepID=A0A512C5N6_9BACT|nr:hypothetical protein CQA01_00450 [Cyclobacterium qasimii]
MFGFYRRNFKLDTIVMETSYLDYYKRIIKNVRFDLGRLKNEINKANQILTEQERDSLKKWMLRNGLYSEKLKGNAF